MKSFKDILNMCTLVLNGNLHRFQCGSCSFSFDVGTLNEWNPGEIWYPSLHLVLSTSTPLWRWYYLRWKKKCNIYINIQVTNEGMAASENDDALDSTKIDSEFVSKKVSD